MIDDFNRISALLDYDPSTGCLTWRVRPSRNVHAGQLAGTRHPKGYLVVRIERRAYYAHRLAWLLAYGCWPSGQVDHENGQKTDNRKTNLRVATGSQNRANSRLPNTSTSGLKGVSQFRDKWRASIRQHRKSIHLGTFDTPQEAHRVYADAAERLFGRFARAA